MQLQFLSHLIRESRQRGIIEIRVENEALVPPVGFDICGLSTEIDVVLGVDLQLRSDLGVERCECRPYPPQIGDANLWVGQQFERRAAVSVATQSQTLARGFGWSER